MRSSPRRCARRCRCLRRGALACDDQQHGGHIRAHAGQHAQQEVDVLLEGHPAYVHQDRLLRRDAVAAPEGRAVPAGQALQLDARRNDLHGGLDAVLAQHIVHRTGRHHDRIEVVALRAREAPRQRARPGPGHQRHVVVQILLEEGVIGLHPRHAQPFRQRHARVVGDKGRLDVDQVEAALAQGRLELHRGLEPHQSIFRIEGHCASRQAHDAWLGLDRRPIGRRDQQHLVAERGELPAKGLDGRGHPVDAREVHVGEHQNPHAASLLADCDRTGSASPLLQCS